jgi:hypothetical protein
MEEGLELLSYGATCWGPSIISFSVWQIGSEPVLYLVVDVTRQTTVKNISSTHTY